MEHFAFLTKEKLYSLSSCGLDKVSEHWIMAKQFCLSLNCPKTMVLLKRVLNIFLS